MKTILFLENGVYGGGSFESLFLLVAHLDKTRFRPLVVLVNKTALYERLYDQDILTRVIDNPVYSQKAKHLWSRFYVGVLIMIKRFYPRSTLIIERLLHRSAIRAVCALIKEYQVELLHLNNQSLRDLYGVIAAKKMKIPCVSYLRSARVRLVPPSVARFLNVNVAQFIANSRFTKIYWERLGINQLKIQIVYNAIENIPIYAIDARKEWRIASTFKYVIGCVGNLTEGKGQEFLIKAFKKALDQGLSAVLLMVGDGSAKKTLFQLVSRLGMQSAVIFTGYDPRAREIIAGLDLLILPSRTETFGRVLLEAMAAGTPIIATRVGGIPEVIKNEQSGLLVEYGDDDGLARAMLKIFNDQKIRELYKQTGREMVQNNFNTELHTKRIEKIYDQAID